MKWLLWICFLVSLPTMASTKDEIDYLLDFVKSSSCTFERNGSQYNAIEATEHINKKYRYYRDDIKSAEDFIRLSASKSMFSGKAYFVQCPSEKRLKSQDWLLGALKSYRAQ